MTRHEVVTGLLAIIERHVSNPEIRAAILADVVRILLDDEGSAATPPVPRRR